jgi:putative Mg2+ transporter-C (MgtC) family protein
MNINQILDITPFNWISIITTLACGILVGVERQIRRKPVGIRTASLITFGTYVFTAISISVNNDASDPSRIIGQVVTGVGFLGAGVMMTKDGTVVGVTSAATIWVLAAIGVVVAVSPAVIAIKLAVMVIAILYGVQLLESYVTSIMKRLQSGVQKWRHHDDNHRIDDNHV